MSGCARRSRAERAQARSSRLHRRQAATEALTALAAATSSTSPVEREDLAVVLEPAREDEDPRPLVLSEHRWAGRISTADYAPGASATVGTMSLPKRVEHRQPRVRRDLASALRSAAAGLVIPEGQRRRGGEADPDTSAELAGAARRAAPPSRTPGRTGRRCARVGDAYLRVERENAQLRQKIAAATNSLAQQLRPDRRAALRAGLRDRRW